MDTNRNVLTAEHVMQRNVFVLSPDAQVLDAVEHLLQRGFSGAPVVERGKLVLSPAKVARYSLQALVSEITVKNRHHEIDFGEPVGKERV